MKLASPIITAVLGMSSAGTALAQDAMMSDAVTSEAMTTVRHSGVFSKKRYSINGDWTVVIKDGRTVITFNDNFKTKGGPDLKVFLSPRSVDDLTSRNALDGAQYVSVLQSNSGEQSYILPGNIKLDDFKSVIIQCEAFSELWGGFDIPSPAS
ncbi:MAG: DM13 domain-containing protein [Hyphomonadaceae bacterium]|nr:DM13 domain-containing protein [Hyphomonadaceae bacterium]